MYIFPLLVTLQCILIKQSLFILFISILNENHRQPNSPNNYS